MRTSTILSVCLFTLVLGLLSVQIDTDLLWPKQWHLMFAPNDAVTFADIFFVESQLPRLAVTLLVGAMLGLVGSLMQQLTQNNLTSPLTLGTSSGAWLALVIVNIWFVDWVVDYSAFAAMVGAITAFGLIVAIAGIRNMMGLPLIVSGMVVNILLGSIAAALVALNQQFAQNIFMWGAGDLAQYSWEWFTWLLPRLSVSLLIILFAPRVLTLLRLGQEGAKARGLSVLPAFAILMMVGIWLVSVSITAVGLISFIGLLTPNIARSLGARTPREELLSSLLLGATLLLVTDCLAMWLSIALGTTIPSGVAAAAIGAPALIWFSRQRMSSASDRVNITMVGSSKPISRVVISLIATIGILGVLAYTFIALGDTSHVFTLPGEFQWQLRWPRMLTAISVGVALAIAGIILQRVVYNPLASPDILGVSSGATFAIIVLGVVSGSLLSAFSWGVAFAGSLAVLALLLLLGKKSRYNPSGFILSGIALTALLQALVQFTLAQGTGDSYKTLLWLTGSTYRVTASQSVLLALAVSMLMIVVFAISRWLTLISVGREFATARGLNSAKVSGVSLTIVALMCAFATATMGPVSFIGLVAPHMASMLGAKTIKTQLVTGSIIGGTLMIWADWIGQALIYPNQIAAGTLVATLGSGYFLLLMLKGKFR